MLVLGVSYFFLSSNVFSRVPDIKSRLYVFFPDKKDVSFSITSPSSTILIKDKIAKSLDTELLFKVFYLKGKRALKIEHLTDVENELKEKISERFILKSNIVIGPSLEEWLDGYEFVQEEQGWFSYEDKSDLKDIAEIKIRFLDRSLNIIEKKPTGTLRTNYIYETTQWSNGQLVLKSVHKEMYEGTHSVITESVISYNKFGEKGYLPAQLNVTTNHKIELASDSKDNEHSRIERSIGELYIFSDYKINEGISQTWFEGQKEFTKI